ECAVLLSVQLDHQFRIDGIQGVRTRAMRAACRIVEYAGSPGWRQWLTIHHSAADGVWLRLYKKNSGIKSISYAEALDDALCYGWIDAQSKAHDLISYLKKFTPRRARSMWSKRNVGHVARLSSAGLMMPSGLAEVARAKADGRWQAAYHSPREM